MFDIKREMQPPLESMCSMTRDKHKLDNRHKRGGQIEKLTYRTDGKFMGHKRDVIIDIRFPYFVCSECGETLDARCGDYCTYCGVKFEYSSWINEEEMHKFNKFLEAHLEISDDKAKGLIESI